MSSFNTRFARFYYNMPKEIQSLENVAKLYYETTFPIELSLLLLEKKSVTLQNMLIDCLEVGENLRMSEEVSGQDSGDRIKEKLDLFEQHKQEGTFSMHIKPSLSKHRNGQPSNLKEDGFTNLFFEDCNQLVTNLVSGDLKKYFSMPIYDEYEDKDLDVVPKKPVINFVISRTVREENMTVIQSQRAEKRKENEGPEGDRLPLCYSSF